MWNWFVATVFTDIHAAMVCNLDMYKLLICIPLCPVLLRSTKDDYPPRHTYALRIILKIQNSNVSIGKYRASAVIFSIVYT